MAVSKRRRRRSKRTIRTRSSGTPTYDRLHALFGEVVDSIERAFLALDEPGLNCLLKDYGVAHGEAAERYARKTFLDWRAGGTRLSGKTKKRLIGLVPPHLSSDQRLALLEILLKRYPQHGSYCEVRINSKDPGPGFAKLARTLEEMSYRHNLAYLPGRVMEAARWLYANDITLARAMLASVERRNNDLIRSAAEREIEGLREAVESGRLDDMRYRVEMPAGVLEVEVVAPKTSFWARLFS